MVGYLLDLGYGCRGVGMGVGFLVSRCFWLLDGVLGVVVMVWVGVGDVQSGSLMSVYKYLLGVFYYR